MGHLFFDPGYPDTDICSQCKEHAGSQHEEDIEELDKRILAVQSEIKQLMIMESEIYQAHSPSERWNFLDDAQEALNLALVSNEHYH